MKKLLYGLLAVLVFLGLEACSGREISSSSGSVIPAGERIIIRSCNSHPADYPWNIALAKMHEIVSSKSGGRIEMALSYSSALGAEPELVESVRQGTLELACSDPTVGVSFCKELELTSLPFLFRDRTHWIAVLDGPVGQKYTDLVEQKSGLRMMAYWGGVSRDVLAKTRPVKSISDLRGFKMRLAASELKFQVWEALGAIPIFVAYPETYSALVAGLVDGMENELPSLLHNKFYEPAKYLTLLGHEVTTRPVFMNAKWLDSKDPGDKEIITNAIKEVTPIARDMELEESKTAVKEMSEKYGVSVFEIDKTPFLGKLTEVYRKYGEASGIGQMIADIQAVK
jgi:tripartite ATP-independent transporter DctP family solute receptor